MTKINGELSVNQMKWFFRTDDARLVKWCEETGNMAHLDEIRKAHEMMRFQFPEELDFVDTTVQN